VKIEGSNPHEEFQMGQELLVQKLDLEDEGDMETLLSLLSQYAKDDAGGGEDLPADVKARLPEELRKRKSSCHAFACRKGDTNEAVGLAICFDGFSTFKARPILNIHDCVTVSSHRRQGVCSSLLSFVSTWAEENSYAKITLEVLSLNEGAKECYRKNGFAGYALDPTYGVAEFWQRLL